MLLNILKTGHTKRNNIFLEWQEHNKKKKTETLVIHPSTERAEPIEHEQAIRVALKSCYPHGIK